MGLNFYRQTYFSILILALFSFAGIMLVVSWAPNYVGSEYEMLFFLNILTYLLVAAFFVRYKYIIYFDAWFILLSPLYYLVSYVFCIYYDFSPFGSGVIT